MEDVEGISLKEVKYVSLEVAKELKWKEEIPSFDTADKEKLESSLCVPFQSFEGKYFYESLTF